MEIWYIHYMLSISLEANLCGTGEDNIFQLYSSKIYLWILRKLNDIVICFKIY